MRQRIYVDGKPGWSDNELGWGIPHFGVGGAALGQVLAAPVKPGKPKRLPRQPAKRYKPDCGFAMPRGSVCARYPHRDHHHRAKVVETLA